MLSHKVLLPTKTCPEAVTVEEIRGMKIPEGTVIKNACLAAEKPDTVIFPDRMIGVTFIRCNLDNVYIPDGNKLEDSCSIRRYEGQVDGEDWMIDKEGNPVEPVNKERFIAEGKSIDPGSIKSKLTAEIEGGK